MSTNKRHFRERFLSANRKMLQLLEKSKPTLAFYEHIILPVEVFFFKAGNYKISPTFRQELIKAKETFFTEEEKQNPRKSRKLENQLIKSYISQQFTIKEFFLYGLRDMKFKEKRTYLSDLERKSMLDEVGNEAAYNELTNKGILYMIAKKYFKREAFVINQNSDVKGFIDFVSRHSEFIVKPLFGSSGRDATIQSAHTPVEARNLFAKLSAQHSWIVEELIQQAPAMSVWNASSVNTLRVPVIDTKDGIKILQPYFRIGRKGSVVDNTNQGGIFAVFEPETGIVSTDGIDKRLITYECHPDSGLRFKGWQIPQYDELKLLAAEILHMLPSHPRYISFDFALTPSGWVLVEGNYNGQFTGQIAEHKGVRKEFIEYYCNQRA